MIAHGQNRQMTASEKQIRYMLRLIRRRWTSVQLVLYAGVGLAVVMLWLAVMVVLDNVVMFESRQFLAGWALLSAGVVVWAAAIGWRVTLGRPRPERFALMYEARVKGQNNRLINAVQMLLSGYVRQDAMAMAVLIENARALDERAAPKAIDTRPGRNSVVILACCAAVVLAYGLWRPAFAINALSRLAQPFDPPVHVLTTDIHVVPGDAEVIESQPFPIRATLSRNVPVTATLEYRVGDFDWSSVGMTRIDDNTFGYDGFKAMWHPLQYRVAAGRSVSRTYRATLRYHPRIEKLSVAVTRPAYAGGNTVRLKDGVGDISELVGSTVALSLAATRPIDHGFLDFIDGSEVAIIVDTMDPRSASVEFPLKVSGSYVIRVTDADGLNNVKPTRHNITAEPDQTPLAVVARPGRDMILPLDSVVDVAVEAQDDVGLASVTLQTQVAKAGWSDTQEWNVSAPAAKRRAFQTSLPLAELGLKVGDVLLYRAMAVDRREPKPNTGIGRTWSITVSDEAGDQMLLADQTRRLLEAINAILDLQRTNRKAVADDLEPDQIRDRQRSISQLTRQTINTHRKVLRPSRHIIRELVDLADGPMTQAISLLRFYTGSAEQRRARQAPVLAVMDQIIAKLEALIGQVDRSDALAKKAKAALDQLPDAEKEQALKNIRATLEKLRRFIPEQDKVISDTEELVRAAGDFTAEDLQKIEQLKDIEDRWAQIFTDSVTDIAKLTEQGFADSSIANDFVELVEEVEAAGSNLTPKLIEMAVPRELAGRELAESLAGDMEMWLPNTPDHIKWMMEEPLDLPLIPMVDLPDQLYDLIGDLIEDQDALNDMAEDVTSAWADSLSAAGWAVMDGPISNFSAVGKTGNQLPDNHELSGRAGEGRSGRSQGQMVEDTARGLVGRKTPTRISNDAFEQGVVKELKEMATGGATGGGKARGVGQEGLAGSIPPPLYKDLQYMKDWQQRIRGRAQKVAGQLKTVRLNLPDLDHAIELMKDVEQAHDSARYADMFKRQQMVLQRLRMTGDLAVRDVAMRIDRAYHMPADQRKQVLDAMSEPVPHEYEDAVNRYFLKLSENP